MAGIYIHIPFCRQKCFYCDFYKTIKMGLMGDFLAALKREAILRKSYLENETVDTIYFGGGTPSVLKAHEFSDLLAFFRKEFPVSPDAEITFEANPDDLEVPYIKALSAAGFNRLSIGIQAFQEEHLKRMNRRHNVLQALHSVEDAFECGFQNISVDLIYGLPGLTTLQWKEGLSRVFTLPVKHLSAYHITYHPGTVFYKWLKEGSLMELPEAESLFQFGLLIDKAVEAGFEHYEISSFAKNGYYSRHNMAYWTGEKYLGLGPSSHSFNGVSRRWNVSSVEAYVEALNNGTSFFHEEYLSENEKFNEYILTHFRTKWGVSKEQIRKQFGKEKGAFFLREAAPFLKSKKMNQDNGIFTLSREGIFISDEIMARFMII